MTPSLNSTIFVTPVVVISSRPSAPWVTHTRSEPRLRKTSAIGSSHAAEKTPINCRLTPAGFDKGPSRLNTVRVPSSTRVGPTWRIAA